jgi:hypothetical protein
MDRILEAALLNAISNLESAVVHTDDNVKAEELRSILEELKAYAKGIGLEVT